MVDILLSTYQGECYLEEQLQSILKQTNQDWQLVVRDDGSTDGTMAILAAYGEKYPDKIKIVTGPPENIGAIKSFEYLLTLSSADYIMFCDQDDVWLPEKIEKTLQKVQDMQSEHPGIPLLVHTDLTIVDMELNLIDRSFWHYSRLDQALLTNFNYLGVCNGVTGCTLMINQQAKEKALPFPPGVLMHDAWIALVVAAYGKIAYVAEPLILYRQHQHNVVGAQKIQGKGYIASKLSSVSEVLRSNRRQFALLKELHYGSIIKYWYFKLLYFFKARV